MADDLNIAINEKITDLEERANALEKEYDCLLKKTDALDRLVNNHASQMKCDGNTIALLETLLKDDDSSKDLFIYITFFFNVVVEKVRPRCSSVDSVKTLRNLQNNGVVHMVYIQTLLDLGFTETETRHMKIILDFANASSTKFVQQNAKDAHRRIRHVLKFIQRIQESESSFKDTLLRVAAIAHCAVVNIEIKDFNSKQPTAILISPFLVSPNNTQNDELVCE